MFTKFIHLLLSILGYFQYIPRPSPLDFSHYEGPSSLLANQTIFITVLLVHVLFFIFAYLCVYWDRVDYFMHKRAIHLNDVPAGTYRYLITIYTNWRPGAGTSGKVYLQLQGSFGRNTHFYYLHNPYMPYRRLFGWGDISWFLVNCAYPLGNIQTLCVMHDDCGSRCAWFLSKILVKDLQTNQSYRFSAHCWLSRRTADDLNSSTCQIRLEPADPSYVEPFGERMFEWVRRLIRERPLFGYCFLNLISNLSRVRMLAITYFYIHFYMLLNLMYFSVDEASTFAWLFNLFIKCLVSLGVQLLCRTMFSHRCFTTRIPTQAQFNFRVVAITLFGILSLAQVICILLYSIQYKNNAEDTNKWLYNFVLGLIQSELGYSHLFNFVRSYLNALFEIDPFAVEEAKLQLTSRITEYKKIDEQKVA